MHVDGEAHVVEDEELRLWAAVDGVADAARLQMGFGANRGGAGVAGIELAARRIDDVAEEDQLVLGREGVHHRGREVRLQDHVGLVDGLPAGDGGAVEHDALGQLVLTDGVGKHGQVLPLAARIGEAVVDVLDVIFFDQLENGVRV